MLRVVFVLNIPVFWYTVYDRCKERSSLHDVTVLLAVVLNLHRLTYITALHDDTRKHLCYDLKWLLPFDFLSFLCLVADCWSPTIVLHC